MSTPDSQTALLQRCLQEPGQRVLDLVLLPSVMMQLDVIRLLYVAHYKLANTVA